MSDHSEGPGWWQASDGKWYPPDTHPDESYRRQYAAAPPPPQQAYQAPPGPSPATGAPSRQEAKAEAKAAAARAKALRPWFKKKRFILPLAVVLIGVIAAVAGGGGDDDDDDGNVTASGDGGSEQRGDDDNPNRSEANLWDRPDEKDGDKEREIGGTAELSGYTVTVTAASHQPTINDFEDAGYIVAELTLLNRDDDAQSYNTFDWKLITPSGNILDPCICGADQLGSGDLAGNGGTVSGRVIFEVGDTPGDYYVIFDPSDLANDNRGVWRVTV